ncbi:MAG: HD domain-containing protein [Gammaproteobacteria bacterium]|nr:HD domain-containing protein [Gammaproteobacteria bacterium]MBU1623663.1 HD domain-containing protein [Gammaproteobacteria bacterium]
MGMQLLFVWLYWEQGHQDAMVLWLCASLGLHLVELAKWLQFRHRLRTLEDCHDWHQHFTYFALISGLLWGLAAVIFFPADLLNQGMMISIMTGLVAVAITLNPVHPPASISYLAGIMVPLMLRVASENDAVHWKIAGMLLLFNLVVLFAGRVVSRNYLQVLQQRFENSALLLELEAQRNATEDARASLEQANAELREHEEGLENMVRERTSQLRQRTEEISLIKDATILALSSLAETRDNETGNHIKRTQHYVRLLALHLRDHPRFRDFLNEENIELLFKLAPLHDVGKVGIPDHILLKPSKLTEEEFEIMKQHALLGGNAIAAAENEVNIRSHFLRIARQIAVSHHEKWDGSGYPFGLKGDDIPISARLMAVADVYDAVASRRVYKNAVLHDDVVKVIEEGSGKHFDPDIVEVFKKIKHEFAAVAEKFCDDIPGETQVSLI